jgi:taurine transport system ATP-binding protein
MTFGEGTANAFTALNDVNLSIKDKDFCCIIGPSGCGKTTLLRLIGGFLKKTTGSILLNGEEIKEPGADRGIVFQEYALFPWMNVIENVQFGLRMKGMPKAQRRKIATEALDMVGLTKFQDAATYNLSGGMQQRVAIIRALVNDPAVLLMDEPLGALDALTREELEVELIKIWKRTHKTIIFITHDVEEAIFMASRLVIMTKTPGKVKEVYELDFSKEFGMNYGLEAAREIKTSDAFIDIRTKALKSIWGEQKK